MSGLALKHASSSVTTLMIPTVFSILGDYIGSVQPYPRLPPGNTQRYGQRRSKIMNTKIDIIDYHPRYTDQTVSMWRTSKESALGIPESHDFDQHRYYLNRILAATNHIYLAIEKRTERVLAMIAFDDRFISQLYVDPNYQHQGIGSALVDLAKETTRQDLHVYTSEINQTARTFWQKHGFIEKEARQHCHEEGLLDILYEWQRNMLLYAAS
ncbi:GNAT family N-acetyltransferase [Grimontia hollisae]|uniref:GNAT family N-acetyltransferase n=1 Tax=Grimontia hollisae TaxID=673 RepID=UPI000E059F45|nr:GNAT family N-acetyltransferase [Grimontia hollisae]STO77708.1 putative acetyltransferase [Grimontia hollisae]